MASEILATRRFWPGGGYGDDALRQLSAEWSLVQALTQSSVWQEARIVWAKTRRTAKVCLMGAKLQGDDLAHARERILGADIADEIASEIQGVYEDAVRVRREQPTYQRPQEVDPIRSEADAHEAIRDGEAVIRMVELPGWEVICQRLIARSMAHYDLLRDCDPADVERHRRAMRDALWPIRDAQRRLDRAAAAVAWLRAAAAPDGTNGAV